MLFDTGSTEDLISPALARILQCTFNPVDMDVHGFTPGIRTQITQKAEKVQFSIQQVSFERDFLVAPLTGCDMLWGNPWMEFHTRVIFTKEAMLLITEGVASPITIVCDQCLPGIPLISYLQARRVLRKGEDCALLYVRVHPPPQQSTEHAVSSFGSTSDSAVAPGMEPRMEALVTKYKHLMVCDGLPPQLPPSRRRTIT